MMFEAHGELGPYLAKHPGLFGLYNGCWINEGAEFRSGDYDLLPELVPLESEKRKTSTSYCGLLPPICFSSFDMSMFYEEFDLSDDSSSTTPSTLRAPIDQAEDATADVASTCKVRRSPATRISRPIWHTVTTGVITSPEQCDFAGLDRLIARFGHTVDSCRALLASSTLQGIARAPATINRDRLHELCLYAKATAKDVLLTNPTILSTCSHQLFPNVRPPSHPLASNPPPNKPSPLPVLRSRAEACARAFAARYRWDADGVVEILALLTAQRAAAHLVKVLAGVKIIGPSSAIGPVRKALHQRTAGLRSLESELELFVAERAERVGMKPHRFTLLKKKWEGIGYLPIME